MKELDGDTETLGISIPAIATDKRDVGQGVVDILPNDVLLDIL